MKFRIAAVLLLATFSLPNVALANELQDSLAKAGYSCWARTYDEAHLKAHPKQLIANIRLSPKVQPDGAIAITLGFKIRGKAGGGGRFGYNAFAFCKPNGAELKCVPEWAAGYFSVKTGPRNKLSVTNHGLVVNPSNYDSEDIADEAIDLGKADDKVWVLSSVYPENCSGN